MIIKKTNPYLVSRTQNIVLQGVEYSLTVILFLIFSGATTHLGTAASLGRAVSYPILLLLISIRWKKFADTILKDVFLLSLVLVAILSVEWSISPDMTIDHGRGLLRSTALGAYLATRYQEKDQLQLLAVIFGVCIVISFVLALAIPSLGTHMGGPHGGLWRGAFAHKNALGRTMNVSAQVFLLLALSTSKKLQKWLCWLGYLLSVLLILLSDSTTALACVILLSFLIPSFNFLSTFLKQKNYKLQVTAAILSFLSIVTATISIASISEYFLASQGKDLSFNGRTELWNFLLENYINQRPFWGYGYTAFWEEFTNAVSLSQRWHINHAHNGFLELLLSLGLLGLFLYLASFIPTFFRAFFKALSAKSYIDFWPFQLLVLILITDLTIEASILSSSSIIWIVFVSTSLSIRLRNKKEELPYQSYH